MSTNNKVMSNDVCKNLSARMTKSKMCKNDEFYTRLEDIEKEMIHYKKHFKNAVIYCNCDNPKYSNFWKYFHINFANFGLKKLMATHLVTQNSSACLMEYTGGNDSDVTVGTITSLRGNGDFRSDECVKFLCNCDIVITNPPFSLLREFIKLCVEWNTKFLILGNHNVVPAKDIFPLFVENKFWYGVSVRSGGMYFYMKKSLEYEGKNIKIVGDVPCINLGCIRWLTNLSHDFIPKMLPLTKKYTADEYPKYDTYDAIEVNKTKNIPFDYDGVMGVPISFLSKWNPEQFKIIGEFSHGSDNKYDLAKPIVNGKEMYKRIAIKRKK